MILAQLIQDETGVPPDRLMLLRHSSSIVSKLLALGGSVEEYTFVQPTGSAYDYLDPLKTPIEVVVVIVDDKVHSVYRVLGIEKEGTTHSLTGEAHRSFDKQRGRPERRARRFNMVELPSKSAGKPVHGWEGRSRTTVQRSDGGFFWTISVDLPEAQIDESVLREELERAVQTALKEDAAERQKRLARASVFPRRIEVKSIAFARNADVIAEVLVRAGGRCELCKSPAPFVRRSDGRPYLEVHHNVRLSDGGEDSVRNAVALCLNCHRREHYA